MAHLPSEKIQGIYLDVSPSPFRGSCLFKLLAVMQNAGSRYFFIDFGEYFPWSEDFHFGDRKVYPEIMMQKLNEKACQSGVEIIPVLSVFDKNDFIIREKHYRHFAPGFPDNPQIVHTAVGLTALYGEMIDDLFALLPDSKAVCLKVPPARFSSNSEQIRELSRIVSEKGKEMIVQNLSVPADNVCSFPVLTLFNSYHPDGECSTENMYYLKHTHDSPVVIAEIISSFDFLPFNCLEDKLARILSIGENTFSGDCADTCFLLEDFRGLLHQSWNAYENVSEDLSMFFMHGNSSVIIALFEEMAHFEKLYQSLLTKAQECLIFFKSDFNDMFLNAFFRSKTEPLEEAVQRTALMVKRIKRRLE